VINYTCPEDEKMYLHRVGRTARAGADGVAVTFVDWADLPRWSLINKALGLPFAEPAETYSTSDWLYTALSIPRTAKGVLPRAARTRAGLDAEKIEDLGETGKARRSGAPSGRGGSTHRDSDSHGPKRSGRGSSRRADDGKPSSTAAPSVSAVPASDTAADATPRTRSRSRSRNRRRTRSGNPVSGNPVSGSPVSGDPVEGATG
jgi:superfamily II DNA/RNA helicase